MFRRSSWWALPFVLLSSISVCGQLDNAPPVSKVFATLSNSVELRTAVVGDELALITLADLIVDKQVAIPKGSRLVGRVAGVVPKGKNEPKSVLAIRIEKAIIAPGREIELQAIIAAIAAPPDPLDSDPTYAMLHSNEPKMISSSRTTSSTGGLPASSKANSNAAVATAEIKGRMDEPLLLTEESQGVSGYEGITMAWHLSMPPPLTVFVTKAKNLKLEAGTQMLLRMAQPRIAK